MTFPRLIAPLTPCNSTVERCPTARQEASQRILIVKYGAFGDILMATPLLTALRRSYPDAHLTWIVDRQNLQAVDANPFLDEIILWDGSEWSLLRSTRPRNWVKNRFGVRWLVGLVRLKRLLYHRFDLLISFHPEQALMRGAAAPKESIGVFQSPRQARTDYQARYTHSFVSRYVNNLPVDFPVHQTDTYLLPLEALRLPPATDTQMVMGYTADDESVIARLLTEHSLEAGFVVLAPKTTWESKCWPDRNWTDLGNSLSETGHTVVLMGSAGERAALEAIALGMHTKPPVLAGTLSFREAAALLTRASVCVSSDSGPMHLAAAVRTPFVSLFGPTPPARYAPLAGTGRILVHPVPCAPCMEQVCPNPPETFMACLRLLTVSEVREAVLEILERPPRPNSGEPELGQERIRGRGKQRPYSPPYGSPELGWGGFPSL